MGINLKNVAAYIHGQPPSALDGLFQAVEAKCKDLKLTPGRRDNVSGNAEGTSSNVNVRGVLAFVDGVTAISDEENKPLAADAADKPAPGDSLTVLSEKENRRANLPARETERKARVAAKQAALDDLRRLYGTLQARFAASGYKPKVAAVEAPQPAPVAPAAEPAAKPAAETAKPASTPTPAPDAT